jgi:hypothetical protein
MIAGALAGLLRGVKRPSCSVSMATEAVPVPLVCTMGGAAAETMLDGGVLPKLTENLASNLAPPATRSQRRVAGPRLNSRERSIRDAWAWLVRSQA